MLIVSIFVAVKLLMSIVFMLLQSSNMPFIEVKLGVLKLERLTDGRLLHPLNIYWKFVTLVVSKLDIFRLVRLEHPWNKLSIPFPVTFDVLKLERSRLVIPLQPLNISLILVTEEVSKDVTIGGFIEAQPWNIQDISVTVLVSKLRILGDASFLQPRNIQDIEVTLDVLNLLVFQVMLVRRSL